MTSSSDSSWLSAEHRDRIRAYNNSVNAYIDSLLDHAAEADRRLEAYERGSCVQAKEIAELREEKKRLHALFDTKHADAMIAHRFFEDWLGEDYRGRDFQDKVPALTKELDGTISDGEQLLDDNQAKDEEIAALRKSVLNQAGDNACWVPDPEHAQLPPKEEFLKSCERFHAQRTAQDGTLTGCMTIAQLEQQLAVLKEKSCA